MTGKGGDCEDAPSRQLEYPKKVRFKSIFLQMLKNKDLFDRREPNIPHHNVMEAIAFLTQFFTLGIINDAWD